jgi:NADH dehydrogenase FAD-containing subunit
MTCRRIVIVGGGFAGVMLAQELESLCDTSTEIVVVTRDNHLSNPMVLLRKLMGGEMPGQIRQGCEQIDRP